MPLEKKWNKMIQRQSKHFETVRITLIFTIIWYTISFSPVPWKLWVIAAWLFVRTSNNFSKLVSLIIKLYFSALIRHCPYNSKTPWHQMRGHFFLLRVLFYRLWTPYWQIVLQLVWSLLITDQMLLYFRRLWVIQ